MALTVVTNLSYSVCLTTPLSTTLFSLLKSTGQFLIYQYLIHQHLISS